MDYTIEAEEGEVEGEVRKTEVEKGKQEDKALTTLSLYHLYHPLPLRNRGSTEKSRRRLLKDYESRYSSYSSQSQDFRSDHRVTLFQQQQSQQQHKKRRSKPPQQQQQRRKRQRRHWRRISISNLSSWRRTISSASSSRFWIATFLFAFLFLERFKLGGGLAGIRL